MNNLLAMLLVGAMSTTVFGVSQFDAEPDIDTGSEDSIMIFTGVIDEMYDTSAIVVPNDDQTHILSSGDKVSVDLTVSDDVFEVGDEVVVYFYGGIMESYPLQVNVSDVELLSDFEEGNTEIDANELPPIQASAVVNIEGVIVSVSEDGKSFLLDTGKTVIITNETEMGITGPNAAPKDEQFFEDTFRVGNSISGFTEDDSSDEIVAYAIYNNWSWEDPIK